MFHTGSYYRTSCREVLFKNSAGTPLLLPKLLATSFQILICRSGHLLNWTYVRMKYIRMSSKQAVPRNTTPVFSHRLFLEGPVLCNKLLGTYLLAPVAIYLKIARPTVFLFLNMPKHPLPKLRVIPPRVPTYFPGDVTSSLLIFFLHKVKYKRLHTLFNILNLTPNRFSSK